MGGLGVEAGSSGSCFVGELGFSSTTSCLEDEWLVLWLSLFFEKDETVLLADRDKNDHDHGDVSFSSLHAFISCSVKSAYTLAWQH